ncbi:hypothetical protein GPJ56_002960 [Histomonas meleagridis]|uniref:uncharacterized protein n=1 Tax=Histomonas meleagridis TaxID=135588 RepID=UPI003559DD82|nr:hypothetical protein GPJ56_002960 [Histomonas meleagridis]KAH0796619.1 hypothetical protein GO595_010512 [Histomonas meleagridis]
MSKMNNAMMKNFQGTIPQPMLTQRQPMMVQRNYTGNQRKKNTAPKHATVPGYPQMIPIPNPDPMKYIPISPQQMACQMHPPTFPLPVIFQSASQPQQFNIVQKIKVDPQLFPKKRPDCKIIAIIFSRFQDNRVINIREIFKLRVFNNLLSGDTFGEDGKIQYYYICDESQIANVEIEISFPDVALSNQFLLFLQSVQDKTPEMILRDIYRTKIPESINNFPYVKCPQCGTVLNTKKLYITTLETYNCPCPKCKCPLILRGLQLASWKDEAEEARKGRIKVYYLFSINLSNDKREPDLCSYIFDNDVNSEIVDMQQQEEDKNATRLIGFDDMF